MVPTDYTAYVLARAPMLCTYCLYLSWVNLFIFSPKITLTRSGGNLAHSSTSLSIECITESSKY